MDRFTEPTYERGGRSTEDSFAAHRIKLYKELRRLAEMDAPRPKPAPGATAGGPGGEGAGSPAATDAFLEKGESSGALSRPIAPIPGHSSKPT